MASSGRGIACIWLGLLLLGGGLRAGGETPQAAPADQSAKPLSLALLWHHQSQFAGYYMALEKGFYSREGLAVEIKRGGPNIPPCDELAAGRVDFCVAMLPTAMAARGAGVPLVLLAQVVNRSNFSLVAWKRSPSAPETVISHPTDLAGRRISIWETDQRLYYQAFFNTQGIQPEILPQYYSPSLFMRRGVDACAVMRYNEYHRLVQSGVRAEDIVVFNLWEQGVELPEDGLYTLEATWRDHPERCRALARATLDGWRYAREHEEETLAVVMRYADSEKLPTNRAHMRWMLREILRSIFPEKGDAWTFGQLSPEVYSRAGQLLQRHGSLKEVPAFADFSKTEASHVAP